MGKSLLKNLKKMTEQNFKEEIKRLEKERDKNAAIRCHRVAAKFQRQIDNLIKIYNESKN